VIAGTTVENASEERRAYHRALESLGASDRQLACVKASIAVRPSRNRSKGSM
jgi:hypothetical protein